MPVTLDHLLWAAPDLDDGVALMAEMTGVKPMMGGRHPGLGTRNALLSLSPTTYIEVISPDPTQDLEGTLGGQLAALPAPKLWLFALATNDLTGVASSAGGVGLNVSEPVAMSRNTPEDERLDWSILWVSDDRWPDRLPFFIDWQNSPHPAANAPGGVSLVDFSVEDPNAEELRTVYDAIGCDVPVRKADEHRFVANIDTPNGSVVLK